MRSNPAKRESNHGSPAAGLNNGQPQSASGIRVGAILRLLACLLAAVPLTSYGATGVTITAHGSVAPNGNSPSYTNWFHNAIAAIQRGATAAGNPATDPTAWLERTNYRYVEVIETIDVDPRIDLGFPSLLGIADTSGAAANERGG